MSNTEHVQTGFAELNGKTLYYPRVAQREKGFSCVEKGKSGKEIVLYSA
jgi:hypothetical protein